MGSSFSQPEATPEPDPDPPYPPGLHPLRQRRHETQSWAQADYLVKLVLVGHSGAGKSSLMQRAVDHRFDIDLLHWRTDFCCLTIDYKGLKICFQIWDPGTIRLVSLFCFSSLFSFSLLSSKVYEYALENWSV